MPFLNSGFIGVPDHGLIMAASFSSVAEARTTWGGSSTSTRELVERAPHVSRWRQAQSSNSVRDGRLPRVRHRRATRRSCPAPWPIPGTTPDRARHGRHARRVDRPDRGGDRGSQWPLVSGAGLAVTAPATRGRGIISGACCGRGAPGTRPVPTLGRRNAHAGATTGGRFLGRLPPVGPQQHAPRVGACRWQNRPHRESVLPLPAGASSEGPNRDGLNTEIWLRSTDSNREPCG